MSCSVRPEGSTERAQLALLRSVGHECVPLVHNSESEGYLHESASSFRLVRREDLFSRWQALSARSPREVPMRFLLPGDRQAQLHKMLGSGRSCLALFAAAEALGLGVVSGVPPYVYVHASSCDLSP